MSIPTMNWALSQRLESHQQQILLYVIADSTDPAGVTRYCDPEYMADHARMTRATMFRRLGELETLGLLKRFKFYSERGAPIYEIRLDLNQKIDLPIKHRKKTDEDGVDDGGEIEGSDAGPESQPETLVGATKVSPRAAPESHCCDSICPPVIQESPPNPPPGGLISKQELQQSEKRTALWETFVRDYPSIATMDQAEARKELDELSIDDAEWAVSVLGQLKAELRKAKDRPPKNAHLWLKKRMFCNFVRGKIEGPPAEGVWIVEGSDEDHALQFVKRLAKQPNPFVRQRADGSRGYLHKAEVGPDLLAMLAFKDGSPLGWPMVARGTPYFAAWQARFAEWIGRGPVPEPGDQRIRVPTLWPPKKDGTIYTDDDAPNDDNDQGEQ